MAKKVKIRYLAFQSFTETAGMPQRVFCEGCGATLYDRPELESPSEIIQRYNGTCPNCQKTLLFEIEKVRILPYDENLMPSKARRKWVFSRQGLAVFPHSKRARELTAALSWTLSLIMCGAGRGEDSRVMGLVPLVPIRL